MLDKDSLVKRPSEILDIRKISMALCREAQPSCSSWEMNKTSRGWGYLKGKEENLDEQELKAGVQRRIIRKILDIKNY